MKKAVEILQHYWGYANFRPRQEEIIEAILQKKDVLALLPTGGGKSICYQVPALMQEGICIVVTPLVALMKDQVDQLKKLGIKAYALHSGMSKREIDVTLDNCIYGPVKLLYVAPERLQSELFIQRSLQMNINLLAIDEAHCISQWGYDFRPSYLQIKEFREKIPTVPCLAVTATGTPKVQDDILVKLNFKDYQKFQGSFIRKKLSFSVRKTEDKNQKILDILEKVGGSTIIYVNKRKSTKELSVWLNHNNISANFYHGGLSHDSRVRKQEEWMLNLSRVMVSTNAFGMGINKPDVRLIIHYDIPPNLESYYQEAGRAGRDNKVAFSVILFQNSDESIQKQLIETSHPEPAFLKRVYQSIANYLKIAVGSGAMESYDFDIHEFCSNFNFHVNEVYSAIQKLKEEGLLDLNESFYHPSKFMFSLEREKIYEYQVVHEEYDKLIKSLFRLYGGEAFVQFTNLSERQLAKYLNQTTYQVIQRLESLHKNGIIFYDKIKDKAQLTFLSQRYDAAKLPLNHQRLQERKSLAGDKLNQSLSYIKQNEECRMKVVCRYFGEELEEDCGICDICLSKKKTSKHGYSEDTKNSILKLLAESSFSEKEIIKELKSVKNEEVISVIKSLLEQGVVYYDQSGKLHLIK